MRRICVAGLFLSMAAFAKDKPTVKIQVVSSQPSVNHIVANVPAGASKSATNCDTNGTVSGDSVNANTDCTTVTTPGQPAHTEVVYIPQEHIRVILPNGNHVTLWCQNVWRRCVSLNPGTYDAEVHGNTAWIYVPDLSGEPRKTKYRAVEGWSEQN